MNMKIALCAGLVALVFASPAQAEPKTFKPWKLSFEQRDLDVLVVSYKDGTARTNYYVPFTITNNSKNPAPLGLHLVATVGRGKRIKTHIALPQPHAETFFRRVANSKDTKNVQEINAMKTLAPGKSVKGIAVFGTFDRQWNDVTISVTGLEPRSIHTRVKKYGSNGFTLPHRAYNGHNKVVLAKAGKDADFTEHFVVVSQAISYEMKFTRKGDEFAPQMDPIFAIGSDWTVKNPKIVIVKKKLYSK
jgi:hypothetical protein